MSEIGRSKRLNNLFRKDGRIFICALDHGAIDGPIEGIVSPGSMIRRLVKAGVDVIMTTPGIVRRFHGELRSTPYILRIDGGRTAYGVQNAANVLISDVEEAIRLGADGVVINGFIGIEDEKSQFSLFRKVALKCSRWGIPLLAEMIPMEGGKIRSRFDPSAIAAAARIGGELGADFIKTYYPGSADKFRQVVESSIVPVVIAGGPRMDSDSALLEIVQGAIRAGGAGVAFGRNIFQHSKPDLITRAITAVIHGGKSARQARSLIS